MFKWRPPPSPETLTARARAFADPDLTEAARAAIAGAEARAASITLTPDALIAAAKERTGLAAFGDWPLEAPLTALCQSLNEEMDLHALGRTYAFEQLAGALATRLRMVDLWKRRPEILEQRIERPIIIIGLPRSGTTILHRLLARDPEARISPFWEQVAPLPLGDPDVAPPEPDPRIALIQGSLDTLHTMAPEMARMHEIRVDEPDEDITLLMPAFASLQFEWSYVVPGYSKFYQQADHMAGYAYFKQVLQTMQHLRGAGRWVLKAPQHLEQLGPLMNAFPDATFVQTHRDPVPAIISLASLTTYGQRRYFAHPDPHAVGANIADIVERLLRRGVEDRREADARFVDIQFPDLVADPIGCVRRIYAAGDGAAPSAQAEAAMSAWIADNRQEKHGKHDYAPEDFALDVDALRRRLAFYMERFDTALDKRFAVDGTPS